MLMPIYFSFGALCSFLFSCSMCFFSKRRFQRARDQHVEKLEQQAARAAQAVEAGSALPALPPRQRQRSAGPAAALLPEAGGDPLRAPLLQSIQEDEPEGQPGAPPPVQTSDELPDVVRRFIARSVRDGRTFRLLSLRQLGRMKMDTRGGWKETTALLVRFGGGKEKGGEGRADCGERRGAVPSVLQGRAGWLAGHGQGRAGQDNAGAGVA